MTSTSDRSSTPPERTLEATYRAERGPLLSLLVSRTRRLAAVRGDLAHRPGKTELARASYLTALERCANEPERAHLKGRLATLTDEP